MKAIRSLILFAVLGLPAVASAQVQTSTVPAPAMAEDAQRANAKPKDSEFKPGLGWLIAWNMSLGVGDTFDFASNYSFRGVSLEARYALVPKLSIGIRGAWHVLDEKEDDVTATRGTATVTGTQIRTVNFVPILATFTYTLRDLLMLDSQLWFSLGVGTYYIERELVVGLFSNRDTQWHFGLAPEIGLGLPVSRQMLVFTSVVFNVALESDTIGTQSYFNFNIGFFYP